MENNWMVDFLKPNLVQRQTAADLTPPWVKRGPENFFALLKEKLHSARQKHSGDFVWPQQTLQPGGKGVDGYIETLRKSLLAKGKPLDKVYLSTKDLPVLADFLQQCGYTEARANQCIAKLFENQAGGAVQLSKFFSHIERQGIAAKTDPAPVVLESAAAPRIASVLMDLGLTLKETDRTLHIARTTDGGLDLDKLIAQLKSSRERMLIEKRGAVDKKTALQVLRKLEELGIQVQLQTATDRSVMDDVIAALEKLRDPAVGIRAGDNGRGLNPHETVGFRPVGIGLQNQSGPDAAQAGLPSGPAAVAGRQLPPDVMTSIDQITAKVVTVEEKNALQFSKPSFSSPAAVYPDGKTKPGGRPVAANGRMATPADKDGRYAGNEVQRGEDIRSSEIKQQISALSETGGYKKEREQAGDKNGFTEKTVEILPTGMALVQREISPALIQIQPSNRSFLPTTLFEQFGHHISGAIQRGDGVIRLKLTPPELGTIRVSLDMKENTLRLGLVAENSMVRDVLLASIHELRNSLLNQGIAMDGLDVRIGEDLGRSLMNSNDGAGQEARSQQDTFEGLIAESEVFENIVPNLNGKADGNNLLDLMA